MNYHQLVLSILFLLASLNLQAEHQTNTNNLDSLWTAAIEHGKHGRFDESNAIYRTILKEPGLSEELTRAAYLSIGNNANLAGDFKTFYDCLSRYYSAEELVQIKALADLPKDTLIRPNRDVAVAYHIDSIYYEGQFKGCEIRIPATIDGKEEVFVFDNGCARFSAASESFALSHGIRPIDVKGKAVGVTGEASMWLGIADSLSIGQMCFQNIVFIVMPDQDLVNSFMNIQAILGANIFRLAGEMDFDNKSKIIVFPFRQQDLESNLTIQDDGRHFAEVEVEDDTLQFQLDLGCASTKLSYNYFAKHKDLIEATAQADSSFAGGVGGISRVPVYRLHGISFKACGGCFTKQDVIISTQKETNQGDEDGVIGSDFLLSFDKVVLNLRKMFLSICNPQVNPPDPANPYPED